MSIRLIGFVCHIGDHADLRGDRFEVGANVSWTRWVDISGTNVEIENFGTLQPVKSMIEIRNAAQNSDF